MTNYPYLLFNQSPEQLRRIAARRGRAQTPIPRARTAGKDEAAMKHDVPDDYVPLLITALEHHYAYTQAVQRDDARYQQAADWFKRQPTPISAKPVRTVKRTGAIRSRRG